ncbi:MAG: rod shape-determining protein MreC [bacterium]
MIALIEFIRRHSRSVAFIVSLIFGILISQTPVEFRARLGSVFMDTAYRPFSALSTSWHTLKNHRRENLRLKEELINARLKVEALKEAERENQRLRKALQFSQQSESYTLLAEVVGRGTPRMPSAITVSAGSQQGVIVDLPVIDQDGIIGKVLSVSGQTSIIQLITDPNLKISAMDARSRVQGIVSSAGGGMLKMENVPVNVDIRQGDPIIASGLGGVFPKGLRVGTVKRVMKPQSGLFLGVEIEPSAKISTPEEVFIVFHGIAGTASPDTTEGEDG